MSTIALMAGGTGGHLFPAMALAQELRRRGHVIHLMTDRRAAGYGDDFPASAVHLVPSATPSIRNPARLVAATAKLAWGTVVAWRALGGIRADVAVAFGGYPTVPSFLAAKLRGVPGVVHEQNAITGRANHLLAHFADRVALSFPVTRRTEGFERKLVVTGNPIRDRVKPVADMAYPPLAAGEGIHIVVTGGSQGARVFSDIVPPAIAALPETLRARLRVVQQCRAEDIDRVTEAYRQARINVELAPFFADLPERIARSHLVITRSGASTITELCVIGRPAILVPLPAAIDADQKLNAEALAAAGGGWIAEQASLTPAALATQLTELLADPEILPRAAARAKSLGQPDAVLRLADVTEALASGKRP